MGSKGCKWSNLNATGAPTPLSHSGWKNSIFSFFWWKERILCLKLSELCTYIIKVAVVAEWLRRLTRNQFPSGSAGSSPADCEDILPTSLFYILYLRARRHFWEGPERPGGAARSGPGSCRHLRCNPPVAVAGKHM